MSVVGVRGRPTPTCKRIVAHYQVTGEIYVFTEVVDRAWNESGGTLSLDWHRDLSKECIMEYWFVLDVR